MGIRRAAAARRSRTPHEEAVRVCLLGGFVVRVGERAVGSGGWRLKKAASLVKILALARDHRLHREQAMDLLWPDLDAAAAANNLRQALHVARKTLTPGGGAGFLGYQGEQVALCPVLPLWVDVEAFEQAAANVRRLRDPAAYRAAVELYGGDLLPEDRYEPWAEDRRDGLRKTYLSLLVGLAGLFEERGEIEEAIEAYEQAATEEPALEEAHAGLMRVRAASGRPDLAQEQYERFRVALLRDGIEPGVRVTRLRDEIASGSFRADVPRGPSGSGRHNLPASSSSFVGRERELAEVKRALAMTRLLTLTGVGGTGKTRLALEAARGLAGAYPDGAWLVELAPLAEPALAQGAVAEALGVREQPGRRISATLADALKARKLLLVLDNCEHVVEAAARLSEGLLGSCPDLRVLATSREALGISGETSWPVPPLSVPDPKRPPTPEELPGYESARLFMERAGRKAGSFAPTAENAGAVASICEQLEGIPLAIELAAARVGTLSVAQISSRLGHSLELLTSGGRTASPRQKTLRGALDWSHRLLDEPEKELFGRLSVFAGGWSLEAAEVVGSGPGAGSGIEEGDVLDLLASLADKSLVVVEAGGTEARYRMLEPVRQYARERLEESGEEAARRRHAAWYLAFAREAEPELVGPQQDEWLDRLEREHDNLRAALFWLLERDKASEDGLVLAGSLGEFWRVRGHLREGLGWLETSLDKSGASSPSRVKALVHAGWISWESVDFERAAMLSEEALHLSRELGDKTSSAAALYHLGMIAIYDRMDAESAWALFEESLALRRETGDATGIGRTLQKMGLLLVVRHDFHKARALYEESLALARKTGDKLGIVMALWLGGLAYLGLEDHLRVKALCREGLELAVRIQHQHAVAFLLNVLAASAGARGLAARAARLWGASEARLDSLGLVLGPAERHHYGPYIGAARGLLGDESWVAAQTEGCAMSLPDAVEYAFSEEKREPAAEDSERPSEAFPLPRRQREIVALLARGLSNRRISAELTISERTVETHVARILKRLGFHSRAQVAAWATEQRLSPPASSPDTTPPKNRRSKRE